MDHDDVTVARGTEHLRTLKAMAAALEAAGDSAPDDLKTAYLGKLESLFDVMAEQAGKYYPQIPPEVAKALASVSWKHVESNVDVEHFYAAYRAACEKWMELHWKLPENFRAISLADWIAKQGGITFFDDIAAHVKSGKVTTDDVAAILGKMTAEDKIRFVMAADGDPGVFLAQRNGENALGWPEIEVEIGDLLLSKFEAEGYFNPATGAMESVKYITVEEWFARAGSDMKRIAAEAGVSMRVLRGTLDTWHAAGALKVNEVREDDGEIGFRSHLQFNGFSEAPESHKRIAIAFRKLFATLDKSRLPLDSFNQAPKNRTYAEAIEKQYTALRILERVYRNGMARGGVVFGLSINELAGGDIEALRAADTFAWYDDPINAVEAASVSFPKSARLEHDHIPGHAGWWYFFRPLELATRHGSNEVVALLWKWVVRKNDPSAWNAPLSKGKPGVYFSLFANDEDGEPAPTTKFLWIEGETVAHLLERTAREYRARYAEGGDLHGTKSIYPNVLEGEKTTVEIVERIASFFMAGCLWMEQKIVTRTSARIERHARKRMERETFKRSLSDIQIIQLRRRESRAMPGSEPETGSVNWTCRWVVSGHWRNQFYPSKGKYAAKWIDPYDKGPDGLPFKTPSHKVYAVKR